VGPRAGLDDVEKRKFLTYWDTNSDLSGIQTITRCYTTEISRLLIA
jgi:hypothetical protein